MSRSSSGSAMPQRGSTGVWWGQCAHFNLHRQSVQCFDKRHFRSSLCRRGMWTGGALPRRSVGARGWPAARGTGATRRGQGAASASRYSLSWAWSRSSVRNTMKNEFLSQKFNHLCIKQGWLVFSVLSYSIVVLFFLLFVLQLLLYPMNNEGEQIESNLR